MTLQSIRVLSTLSSGQALTVLLCHCEAQSAEAISRKARGIATPLAHNDKVSKQCVTKVLNEYRGLTSKVKENYTKNKPSIAGLTSKVKENYTKNKLSIAGLTKQ